jgi:hypothetical protein
MGMEINSVLSSLSLQFDNSSRSAKNTKTFDISIDKPAGNTPVFQVGGENSGPDFTAITPNQLRSHATQSYEAGSIDQQTYSTLASPLPTHAIDAVGNVLDLTEVDEDTSFNFVDYYQTQLHVAASIGSPQQTETLQSVVNYLTA